MLADSSHRGVFAAENPMRSERIQQIPIRFESGGWTENVERLQKLGFRAAIVGKKGSGKTCLLEQLHNRIGRDGMRSCLVSLPLDRRQHGEQLKRAIAESRSESIVLLDGVERLTFLQRNQIFRETSNGPGLVVSVHGICRLPTWIRTRTSFTLVKKLLDDLGVATPEVLAAGEVAFNHASGNVREVFRLLYDQFADGRLVPGR